MFTWIFMWTPALDTGEIANLNLGNVFATFMIGVMIGSSSFKSVGTHHSDMPTLPPPPNPGRSALPSWLPQDPDRQLLEALD